MPASNICDFIDVLNQNAECEENFSGTAERIYLFKKSQLYDSTEKKYVYPEVDTEAAAYTAGSFANLQGKLVGVDIKPNSGRVTWTNTPDGGGFTNVGTFIVSKNMKKFSRLARAMNATDFGVLIPTGNGNECYVLFSQYASAQFQLEGDTGAAPDDDHGHTATCTCAKMKYPAMTWAGPATGSLDDWLASAGS